MITTVELKGHAPGLYFRVNDQDVHATAVTIKADAMSIPQVEITLPVYDDMSVEIEADVRVDEHTRASLIALGWTPPDE